MLKFHAVKINTVISKGVKKLFAGLMPIGKLNAQFKTGPRGANKIQFIQANGVVVMNNARDGCLTHTDGSNRCGFNQGNA